MITDPTRRGDLEILGYCLLQWASGKLPWEDKLTDQGKVAREKNELVINVIIYYAVICGYTQVHEETIVFS